jgi:hypothetical protein
MLHVGNGRTLLRKALCASVTLIALAASTGEAGALELPPISLIPPAITGAPVVGQPLGCSQGVWTGPPSSYAYQWTREGSDVPGASLASYTVVANDVGKALRCRVTASNSTGTASATSSPVVGLRTGSSTDPPPTPTSPPGTSPSLPKSGELIRLPANRRCLSTRRFRIRIRKVKGITLAAVAVYLNGKPVKVFKGKRLTARIDLRGLPRGTVRVRIEAATTDGRLIRHTRKYRTCTKRGGSKGKHRL